MVTTKVTTTQDAATVLAGLPDWPGIRVADRLDGLRGAPAGDGI